MDLEIEKLLSHVHAVDIEGFQKYLAFLGPSVYEKIEADGHTLFHRIIMSGFTQKAISVLLRSVIALAVTKNELQLL